MCKAGAAWSLPQLYDTGAPHLVPLNKSKYVKPEELHDCWPYTAALTPCQSTAGAPTPQVPALLQRSVACI